MKNRHLVTGPSSEASPLGEWNEYLPRSKKNTPAQLMPAAAPTECKADCTAFLHCLTRILLIRDRWNQHVCAGSYTARNSRRKRSRGTLHIHCNHDAEDCKVAVTLRRAVAGTWLATWLATRLRGQTRPLSIGVDNDKNDKGTQQSSASAS